MPKPERRVTPRRSGKVQPRSVMPSYSKLIRQQTPVLKQAVNNMLHYGASEEDIQEIVSELAKKFNS